MTFIPSVLTKVDNNNSFSGTITSGGNFPGTFTNTTGYNSIQVNISSDIQSAPSGIQVQFSLNGSTVSQTFYDTYLNTGTFNKVYPVQANFYKIIYTNSTGSSATVRITTMLQTDGCNPESNNSINTFDNNTEGIYDAFGKLRVTNPQTLLDIHYPQQVTGPSATYLNNSLQLCTASNGSVTTTYGSAKAVISVPAVANNYFVVQSRIYCTYQPGKSLLFKASGIIKSASNSSSYVSRIGYFDNTTASITISSVPIVNNGMYYECNAGIINVCISRGGTELYKIPQTSWNIDQMNGNGSSGLNLDFTKTQLFIIDMEWLGVGRIRFGFYAYGKIIYCHQITNINVLTAPYTLTANLPVCYSIHYNGSGTGPGTMTQICSTVISEGGYNPIGRPFSYSSGTALTITTSETPLLAIRGGGNNYYHQNIIPSEFTIVDTNQSNYILYRIRIYQAPNLPYSTGGSIIWNDVDSNYSVSQNAIGTSITLFTTANSITATQGYFSGKGVVSFSDLTSIFTDQILHITSNINLTSDILVLTAQIANTGSTTVYSSISWKEVY